jgi:hypothetical protein
MKPTRHAPRIRRTLLAVAIVTAACEDGDDGLSKQEVTQIPAGDAMGDAHSGRYETEAYTAACDGACGPVDYQGWSVVICDVGDREDVQFEVVQDDGALRIDADDDSLYITRFRGGVYADGSFEVGGYGTELGGDIEITGRVEGVIEPDGAIGGLAHYHLRGGVGGDPVDCRITYETEGSRLGAD